MVKDRIEVMILGEKWIIEQRSEIDDDALENADGYCDKTARLIAVTVRRKDCNLIDFEKYQRKVLRHELIHAFLFESGLAECWTHDQGHDESYVDWLAAQWPKLAKVFADAGVAE